ncbi:MAG: hypothetical protein AAGK97_02700, partial [Bacteroidota bacterium]
MISASLYGGDPMQEFVREMDRSFQIDRDAVVELNNQYGAITINTWDKDQVDIKNIFCISFILC